MKPSALCHSPSHCFCLAAAAVSLLPCAHQDNLQSLRILVSVLCIGDVLTKPQAHQDLQATLRATLAFCRTVMHIECFDGKLKDLIKSTLKAGNEAAAAEQEVREEPTVNEADAAAATAAKSKKDKKHKKDKKKDKSKKDKKK